MRVGVIKRIAVHIHYRITFFQHRLWTNANAAILAEKTPDSSARIAVLMQIGRI
jgi:hypothetical protein